LRARLVGARGNNAVEEQHFSESRAAAEDRQIEKGRGVNYNQAYSEEICPPREAKGCSGVKPLAAGTSITSTCPGKQKLHRAHREKGGSREIGHQGYREDSQNLAKKCPE
jgi:hypothetical protein